MKRDSMSLIACHFFAEEFNSRLLLRTSEIDESSANKDKVKKKILKLEGSFNNSVDILVYFRMIIVCFSIIK